MEETVKPTIIVIGLVILIAGSFILYQWAKTNSSYQGLPTVPCIDYTKPATNQFSLTIHITINGQNYPIDKSLGHDYGNCLHDIFVNGPSGQVFVKTNNNESFNLGQFFDVWKKTFSKSQLFNYRTDQNHQIVVLVNGQKVNTSRNIPLLPNENIEVIYQ